MLIKKVVENELVGHSQITPSIIILYNYNKNKKILLAWTEHNILMFKLIQHL